MKRKVMRFPSTAFLNRNVETIEAEPEGRDFFPIQIGAEILSGLYGILWANILIPLSTNVESFALIRKLH